MPPSTTNTDTPARPRTQPFRTGLARTLARGPAENRVPLRRQSQPIAPLTEPPTEPLTQPMPADMPPRHRITSAPVDPPASGNTSAPRRSQTQIAAILARAVAQGQRNL
jgi:hypothetical protein